MKIIITEEQDEKLTRRVKMMVEKLGLKETIKSLGINRIKHAYGNNPLEFLDNFKNLEKVESPDYPNEILFVKNGKVLMVQDKKTKIFWIDYDNIWSFFEKVLGIEQREIKEILTKWLEDDFKVKGYTLYELERYEDDTLEETIKLK